MIAWFVTFSLVVVEVAVLPDHTGDDNGPGFDGCWGSNDSGCPGRIGRLVVIVLATLCSVWGVRLADVTAKQMKPVVRTDDTVLPLRGKMNE
jgi:hypothetical protein